ncbi:hypothetical protein TNCV_3672581 [Trichonephila clavipes]|nr:hypothetical protein TNCV_3672581 [Trichonephila clavipes]
MATGSYLTPIYSRSQSEVQGDLHTVHGKVRQETYVYVSVVLERCPVLWYGVQLGIIGTTTVDAVSSNTFQELYFLRQ